MNQLQQAYFHFTCLLLISFVLFTFSGNATKYYVSSTGNDANPGTSEDLPWQSLNKVNNFFKLYPGDQVLFKRGDEWSGTVIVRASGTAESPIIYGAYGTGDKPKIYGSEIISGWTNHTGNIYKAKFNNTITQLFINDKRIQLARFPKTGYIYFDVVNDSTFIFCDDLDVGIDYTGAKLHTRTVQWRLITQDVTSSSSKTLSVASAPTYGFSQDRAFFLNNKLEFLTQAGEWYYDRATQTVYLWTLNEDSPSNLLIRGSTTENCIYLNNKDYITIRDLDLEQSKGAAIFADYADYLTVDNCIVKNPDSYGIYSKRGFNNIIKNNKVNGAMKDAISFTNILTSNSSGVIIENNEVRNTGLFEDIGISGIGLCNAMFIQGHDAIIKYNRIINNGYIGIQFYGQRTIVENNYVDGYCKTLNDGGGIYTWVGQVNNAPKVNNSNVSIIRSNSPRVINSKGSVIRNNIILNGNGDGTGYLEVHNNQSGVCGIYLDEASEDVLIEYNTVARSSGTALFYHQVIEIETRNNIIFDNPRGFRDTHNDNFSKGNKFINNIVCNISTTTDFYLNTPLPPLLALAGTPGSNATYDYNTYIDRHHSAMFRRADTYEFLNFSQWKSTTNKDANSTFIGTPLATGETEKLFYNDTKQTKTFNLGKSIFKDIYGNVVKDTFTLQPFTSKILIGKNFENINQSPAVLDQSYNIVSPKNTNDFIGQVVACDPDTGQIINYTIVEGNETEIFTIDSLTGEIHAKTDFQTSKDRSVMLIVRVKDNAVNSLSDSAKVIINIEGRDTSPPSVTSFSIPSLAISLSVPINLFTASDDIAVTGYLLTETSLTPLAGDSSWTTSIPVLYSFLQEGVMHLFAWAKDSAGNVSISASDSVIITLPDMSPTFSTYLFEETEGATVIDSNRHNHGTIFNNAHRVDGVLGRGIEFTGSGYINLGQSFGENVENEISISVWIKPDASTGNYQGIIMHGGPDTATYALYIQPDSKTIGFTTNGTSNALLTIDNVNELWDGNWHHLAAIYNGTEKVIYLDNVVLINIAATGKIDLGWKYNLLIGAGRDEIAPALLYEGLIDEVRIYNYALTSSEVGQLYHPVNKVIKKINITEYVSVCRGKEYMGWSESGQYDRVLQRILPSASGADSIVTTNLQVNPVYNNTEKVAVCEGETTIFGTQKLIAAGEYTKQFETVDGCDSTVVLSLTVHPVYHRIKEATICGGENYTFGAQSLKATGEYTDLFMTVNGCDSTEILILTVNPEYNITEEVIISDTDDYLGWTNEGTYPRNLISSSGCDSVVVTNLDIVPSLTQFIDLEKGWNIFSSYLIPNNENMELVMETIRIEGKLEIVQDEIGNSYQELSPQGWINNIGNLQKTEGYTIRVESPCILEIKGRQIDLPMNIELKKGLNIISFPVNESTDAMQVIEPLIQAGILGKVQDEKGKSIEYWIGIGWINGIGNFNPGNGYIVYANESGTLTINQTKEKSNLLFEDNNTQTTYFRVFYEGNGFAHMNINVIGLNESQLSVGDEIAVFDNHICVGAIKLTEKHFSLNVVGITASASEVKMDNGFTDGNPVEIRVWRKINNSGVKLLPDIIKGEMKFNRYGSVFIKINEISDLNENIDIYPNPANTNVNIQFSILPEEGVKIFLFDISGKEIMSREIQSNLEIINIEHLSAGVYFLKIPLKNENKTHKLVII